MLRFCRVIKYRSVWHVLRYVVSGPKASQKLIAERAGSVSAGGKHDIDESAQRSKRSTETERVMQKWRPPRRSECLIFSFDFTALIPNKVQRQREETIHPSSSELESVTIRDIILSIRAK